jgi:alpha-N-arabinofuranosidase
MFRTVSAAEGLQELFRHSDIYHASAYTALSSLLTWNKTDATASSLGLMFELYRRHYGTIPVEVTGNSPQHDVAGTVFVDKPKVSSGSPTYPLDVTASLTSDHKALTVSIVNPSDPPQEINASFAGLSLQGTGKLYRLAAPDAAMRNEPGKARVVDIVESSLTEAPTKLSIPASSVSIYELPIQ